MTTDRSRPLARMPSEVDLLVLGAGAGGMTAALSAAILGLDVVLIEKAETVGGTTARSAGSVWVPNSRHDNTADTRAQALRYLQGTVGNRLRSEMADAFLEHGPCMVDFLEAHSEVRFRAYAHHPDYAPGISGSTTSGRVLEPVPFDARVLGRNFATLSAPLPEFTVLGGMMVDRTDIGHLLGATRSLGSFSHAARLLVRHAADRLRHHRGTRLVMGNGLAARLFYALKQRDVPVLTATQVIELIEDNGRIAGARLQSGSGAATIRCRRGVVLATGGLSRNPELRRRLLPGLGVHSPVAEGATGDGFALAAKAGGHLGANHANNAFWTPVSVRKRRDGSTAVFPHLVLDRGRPGVIAVDSRGRRFVSEATNYHAFVEAMYAADASPCHLICDDAFIATYGLGMVRPRRMNLRSAIADGYVTRASTLAELAAALQIDAKGLTETIARHNGFAVTGVDLDFAKGSDVYQRNLGDAAHKPNPCMGPIATPPFYAVKLHASELGASAGLVTNEFAQVLRRDGTPLPGLYACGNDMDSMMAGSYPAPGITLGPAMTFGYIAAQHAARSKSS
jgi:succinate dehydrogenase/fumarate reductase flavoprotein subunit